MSDTSAQYQHQQEAVQMNGLRFKKPPKFPQGTKTGARLHCVNVTDLASLNPSNTKEPVPAEGENVLCRMRDTDDQSCRLEVA